MAHRRISSGSPYEKKVGYCRAVVTDDGWVFVAGTTGQDHGTGTYPESVADQARLAFSHIEKALAEAGATFADVVRATYVFPDADDFEPCWPVFREVFADHPPASMMIVAGLASPEMKVEIEVTAKLSN